MMSGECPRCGSRVRAADGTCEECVARDTPTEAPESASDTFVPPTVTPIGWDAPAAGTRLGGFRLEAELGRGGMGAVYRATQESLGRTVALKILLPSLSSDAQFQSRFRREADTLAALAHPRIVSIIDRGVADGLTYFAMEYVKGESVRQRLERGPMNLDEAIQLAIQVCEGLAYAHARGVVHRDVKPENLLLDMAGNVKVSDFGLARLARGDQADATRLTLAGGILGTPLYMAPEQMRSAGDVDRRADLYALGVVLYEALAGEPPAGRFRPLAARFPLLDRRFDALVLRLLDPEPSRRPADADAVRRALVEIREKPSGRVLPRKQRGRGIDAVGLGPIVRWGCAAILASWALGLLVSAIRGWRTDSALMSKTELVSLGKNKQGYEEFRDARTGIVLVHIPAGDCTVGSDTGPENERPAHRVHLRGFLIGRTEVTAAQYLAFCKVARRSWGRVKPGDVDMGSHVYPDDEYANHVTWTDAVDYCAWAEMRLPTEAEWEKAALWHEASKSPRTYPWGESPPTPDHVYSFPGQRRSVGGVDTHLLGGSAFGVQEMLGTHEEWCADDYLANAYSDASAGTGEAISLAEPLLHVTRGTGSVTPPEEFHGTRRGGRPWTDTKPSFRVARDWP